MTLHVVEALDSSEAVLSPTETGAGAFRPLGEVSSFSKPRLHQSSDFLMQRLCSLALYQRKPTTSSHL